MKLSCYNTYINLSESLGCVYNALTDKFLFYNRKVYRTIEVQKDNDSKLSGLLRKGGFIIDDSINELQVFLDKANKIENDMSNAHIIINPTISCNFHCWYCYEKHINSKMSMEVIARVYRLIDSILAQSENLTISFFGGEPFIYYKDVMVPILKYAHDRASQLNNRFVSNATTNGYLLNAKRIEELLKYNFSFAQITLDGGRENHNQTRFVKVGLDSYNKIVQNIKLLAKAKISVTLRINFTKDNIASVCEIPKEFDDLTLAEKEFIHVDFHRVWQEEELLTDLADKAISAFFESGFSATRALPGPYCYGDLRSSRVINYNGDVYKCTADDFATAQRDGYLNENGQIIWENDSLNKRMQAKFSNKVCHSCNIFPLCHGGCSSKPLNLQRDYCVYAFDEQRKLQSVMDKLLYNIRFKWKNIAPNQVL